VTAYDVTFEVEGADEALQKLLIMQMRLGPVQMPHFMRTMVGEYLQARVDQRFEGEGDDVVGLWFQLRNSTRAIRSRQGFGAAHPINRRTGKLHDWVRTYKVNNSTLTMPGTPGDAQLKSKLKVAQVGGYPTTQGDRLGPSMPAPPRPVIGLGWNDAAAIVTGLERWVTNGGTL